MLTVPADRLASLVLVARAASIRYRRPATGPITATGTIADPAGVRSVVDANGRVSFEVDVRLEDDAGEVVAETTVEWVVRSPR